MKRISDSNNKMGHWLAATGFSLIELVVVIGLLALLASLCLLGAQKAKEKAQTIVCANNLKQLQICWYLYLLDNREVLVPNNFIYNGKENSPFLTNASWCPGITPNDATFENIRASLLFPYARSVRIFHCPGDKSMVTGTNLPRTRSYNMSQSVNGSPQLNTSMEAYLPCFTKLDQIIKPTTSQLFVFLDVHEDGISDSIFGTPTEVWGDTNTWWDMPANRHNQGGNFSFADGHVERWKWAVPKKIQAIFPQPVAPGESSDHDRVLRGTLQVF